MDGDENSLQAPNFRLVEEAPTHSSTSDEYKNVECKQDNASVQYSSDECVSHEKKNTVHFPKKEMSTGDEISYIGNKEPKDVQRNFLDNECKVITDSDVPASEETGDYRKIHDRQKDIHNMSNDINSQKNKEPILSLNKEKASTKQSVQEHNKSEENDNPIWDRPSGNHSKEFNLERDEEVLKNSTDSSDSFEDIPIRNKQRKKEHVGCCGQWLRFCGELLECFDYQRVEKTSETTARSDQEKLQNNFNLAGKRRLSRTSFPIVSSLSTLRTTSSLHTGLPDFFPALTEALYESNFAFLVEDQEENETPKINKHGVIPPRKAFHITKIFREFKFGRIYRATVRGSEIPLWLKVVVKEDKVGTRSIINEAMCLESLQDRPYVVETVGNFQTGLGYYLVLFDYGKISLYDVIKQEEQFAVEPIRFYTAELTCAIGFLHDIGIIHRSLNLDNIMLDAQGHILLTDFSHVVFDVFTNVHFFEKSQHKFLAPEMVQGLTYSKSVDWWALGVITYCMMYGQFPFAGSTSVEVLTNIVEMTPTFTYVRSIDLVAFCKALLTKAPGKRLGYGSMGVQAVRSDPFFKRISWSAVEAKSLRPCHMPNQLIDEDDESDDKSVCDAPSEISFAEWQNIDHLIQDDSETDMHPFSFKESPSDTLHASKCGVQESISSRLEYLRNPTRQGLVEDLIKDLETLKDSEARDGGGKRKLKKSTGTFQGLHYNQERELDLPPVVSKSIPKRRKGRKEGKKEGQEKKANVVKSGTAAKWQSILLVTENKAGTLSPYSLYKEDISNNSNNADDQIVQKKKSKSPTNTEYYKRRSYGDNTNISFSWTESTLTPVQELSDATNAERSQSIHFVKFEETVTDVNVSPLQTQNVNDFQLHIEKNPRFKEGEQSRDIIKAKITSVSPLNNEISSKNMFCSDDKFGVICEIETEFSYDEQWQIVESKESSLASFALDGHTLKPAYFLEYFKNNLSYPDATNVRNADCRLENRLYDSDQHASECKKSYLTAFLQDLPRAQRNTDLVSINVASNLSPSSLDTNAPKGTEAKKDIVESFALPPQNHPAEPDEVFWTRAFSSHNRGKRDNRSYQDILANISVSPSNENCEIINMVCENKQSHKEDRTIGDVSFSKSESTDICKKDGQRFTQEMAASLRLIDSNFDPCFDRLRYIANDEDTVSRKGNSIGKSEIILQQEKHIPYHKISNGQIYTENSVKEKSNDGVIVSDPSLDLTFQKRKRQKILEEIEEITAYDSEEGNDDILDSLGHRQFLENYPYYWDDYNLPRIHSVPALPKLYHESSDSDVIPPAEDIGPSIAGIVTIEHLSPPVEGMILLRYTDDTTDKIS